MAQLTHINCKSLLALFCLLLALCRTRRVSCASAEYYSSIDTMIELGFMEAELIKLYRTYLAEQQRNFALYRNFIAHIKEELNDALENIEEYLGNPINAFKLIKRTVVDWANLKDLINQNYPRQILNQSLLEMHKELPMPDHVEVRGAAKGLGRLQAIYHLNASDLAHGEINGVYYEGSELALRDCFEIAANLYDINEFRLAIEWFEVVRKKIMNEDGEEQFEVDTDKESDDDYITGEEDNDSENENDYGGMGSNETVKAECDDMCGGIAGEAIMGEDYDFCGGEGLDMGDGDVMYDEGNAYEALMKDVANKPAEAERFWQDAEYIDDAAFNVEMNPIEDQEEDKILDEKTANEESENEGDANIGRENVKVENKAAEIEKDQDECVVNDVDENEECEMENAEKEGDGKNEKDQDDGNVKEVDENDEVEVENAEKKEGGKSEKDQDDDDVNEVDKEEDENDEIGIENAEEEEDGKSEEDQDDGDVNEVDKEEDENDEIGIENAEEEEDGKNEEDQDDGYVNEADENKTVTDKVENNDLEEDIENEEDTEQEVLKNTLEYLALASYRLGQVNNATTYIDELLRIEPKHNIRDLETYMHLKVPKPKVYFDSLQELETRSWYANYSRLCRGIQVPDTKRPQLHCRWETKNHPLFLLAPLKAEELYQDPQVMVYHNLLSDTHIGNILLEAEEFMERSQVRDGENSAVRDVRVSQQAWLNYDSPSMRTVYRLVEAVSGLNLSNAETMQMANYGIGGQYDPHPDYFGVGYVESFWFGDRITTNLFYLSDVEQGGYTVFPYLNLYSVPEKGALVAWYNLHRSLVPDARTLHAGCPVIKGTKRIGNVWIHSGYQEFRRPCDLVDDQYKSAAYATI